MFRNFNKTRHALFETGFRLPLNPIISEEQGSKLPYLPGTEKGLGPYIYQADTSRSAEFSEYIIYQLVGHVYQFEIIYELDIYNMHEQSYLTFMFYILTFSISVFVPFVHLCC